VQHIVLAAATGKIVYNVLLILLCYSLKIESLRRFCKKCVGLLPWNSFARTFREGVTSLNTSSTWTPPRITEPGCATGDCDHVGLFSNRSLKKVYWWHFAHCHSRFQRRYIEFECKNLVSWFGQEKLWSTCFGSMQYSDAPCKCVNNWITKPVAGDPWAYFLLHLLLRDTHVCKKNNIIY